MATRKGKTEMFAQWLGGTLVMEDQSKATGTRWWVCSVTGTDQAGNGKSPESPLATWDYADNLASDDDLIYLMENHVETVASAGAISLASGARTIGLGQGTNRPTFTFSATASTITVTAANTEFSNIILVPSIDSVVSPIVVSAANCSLQFEVQDASASIEFVRAVLTTAAADNLTLDIVYRGFVAGNACVNAVRLVGGDNIKIGIEFYGKASTSVIEFHTTACSNVDIAGYFYVSGTTDFSKNVVDTATGSTWFVKGLDGAGGASFSGGSGAAVAGDDVSAISSELAKVPKSDSNVSFNATALAAIEGECEDALEGENLDHLQKTACADTSDPVDMTAEVADDTVLANILTDDGDTSNYDRRTDSLEAISDLINAAINSAPTGASLRDILHADGSFTFDNTTDSLEAIALAVADVATDLGDASARTNLQTVIAMLGNPDTAAQSLWDLLAGTGGIASFPAAAEAANSVSLAEVIRFISEVQVPRKEIKTYADLTGYDTAAAFTVTGDVLVKVVGVVGATAIACTSGTTTLSIGTTNNAAEIIAATTIDNADFAAGDVWVDNDPDDDCATMDDNWVLIGGGADIILTRNVDDLTQGTLALYCLWKPMSADGDVTAA